MKKTERYRWFILVYGLAAGALVFAGCAGTKPTRHVTVAQAAVNEAELAGALEHAPLELQKARNKLSMAGEAMKEEEYKKAERLSEQALVDARLAEAKAHTAKSQKAVREVQESIEVLRKELEHKVTP